MKKILLIIPVVFCLVLSSLSIIPVYASDPLQTRAEPYEGSNHYVHPLDSLIEWRSNPKYYFWYNTYKNNDNGSYDIETKFISYNDEISVEEDNGVYTINFLGKSGFYIANIGHQSLPDYDFKSLGDTQSSSKKLIFDSNTNDLTAVWDDGDQQSYISNGFSFNVYETNIFEDSSKSMPNVSVEFTPDLVGEVDRTVISSSGSKSLLSELKMKVTNNSPYAIQYRMTITLKNQVTSRLNANFDSTDKKGYYERHYDDDPVFVYYCNGLVYDLVAEEGQEVLNSQPFKYNKPTDWHYLQPKEFDDVTFDFSMFNLSENVEYVCKVVAYKCDYDLASTMLYTPAYNDNCPAEPRFKQVDTTYFSVAYESTFKMLQFSDIKYDPNKKTGNVLPYDGSKGISSKTKYDYSYDAKTDLITGEQKIGHKDLYNDPNSWISKNYPKIDTSSDFSVTNSTSLLSEVKGFFGFLSSALGYFPFIYPVLSLALSSFLILAIIRRLH